MSGHSKWSTIKRQKGAADIKRGQTFTKVANAITIAVKQSGSGDPNSNPRLRMVMEEAKAVNMPKENVQRAIDRGLGRLPGQMLEEVVYEGFGPGKVAFLIEGVTDNKLRTLQEIKNLFERAGGSLAGQGSVAYLFERIGEIRVVSRKPASPRLASPLARGESSVVSKEDEILELIDLGAKDVEDYIEEDIQRYLVYVEGSELNTMGNKITQAGYTIESQELVMKPTITQEIKDPELAKKVLEFAGRLEENDDIQKVYSNFDISYERTNNHL